MGSYLLPYDLCDTFFSYDGGLTWKMARYGAHQYEIGDMGSTIVLVDDEDPTDHIWYSFDRGEHWYVSLVISSLFVLILFHYI